ncbi:trypsin-like peptidase domain-containing protein [Planomicrobium sp. CPCC 101110]|uniref:trypsin-like peptidase domain-containing protein n=1 Tax=Planomicrobium sp. CPCC 101110 TaxID=2599619 RepID=UPI0011B6919C|nr:trypsin-like peptidase domain-containing protein [Planomicrobium sp. CPCC 101110]TWT28429.1 trypsin-like serine protease [Planomicrobium sp. CPCC 101110]
MFCSNCGYKNKEAARFCIDCGRPMDRITRILKQRKRNKLHAIVLSFMLIGAGFSVAQLNEEEAAQPATIEATASTKETHGQEPAPKTEAAPQTENANEKINLIEETRNKVFTIKTDETSGTGFLFTDSGILVTNAHVVASNDRLIVRSAEGEEQPGRVIGISVVDDVALVLAEAYAGNAPIEVEANQTAVGTEVIAFGSPSGFENSASIGYVTGTGRDFEHNFIYKDMYQIDAQLAPGSSGGPLVDAATGKVIAINSIQYTDGNSIGFSIPMHTVDSLLTDWLNNPMSQEEIEQILGHLDENDWSSKQDSDTY